MNRACDYCGKAVYENRAIALAALRRMPRHRRRILNVYQCRAGRWHHGRKMRRPTAAWKS